MASLPDGIKYGFVTGQFIRAVADSPTDVDALPDAVPAQGTVRFLPAKTQLLASNKALVLAAPDTFNLDTEGWIVDKQNNRGVWFVIGDYSAVIDLVGIGQISAGYRLTESHTPANPLYVPQYVGKNAGDSPTSSYDSGFGEGGFGTGSFGI